MDKKVKEEFQIEKKSFQATLALYLDGSKPWPSSVGILALVDKDFPDEIDVKTEEHVCIFQTFQM